MVYERVRIISIWMEIANPTSLKSEGILKVMLSNFSSGHHLMEKSPSPLPLQLLSLVGIYQPLLDYFQRWEPHYLQKLELNREIATCIKQVQTNYQQLSRTVLTGG